VLRGGTPKIWGNQLHSTEKNFRNAITLVSVCTCLTLSEFSGDASTLYWSGVTSNLWSTASNWSLSPNSNLPESALGPGLGDSVVLNISTLNSPRSLVLNGDQSVLGLSVLNTTPSLIQSGGVDGVLTISYGGITLSSGAGAVMLGGGLNQQFGIAALSSQTWSNSSANSLIVVGGVSGLANPGEVQTLKVAGSGNTVTYGGVGDGVYGGKLSLTKAGAGQLDLLNANNTFSGPLSVIGGTLNVLSLLDTPGAGSNGSGNITLGDADENVSSTLRFSGTGAVTLANRAILIANTTAATALDSSGSGPVTLGTLTVVTPGAKTLSLLGAMCCPIEFWARSLIVLKALLQSLRREWVPGY